MTRHAWPQRLACLFAAVSLGATGPALAPDPALATGSAAAPSTATPLRVSIETLAPATIPRRGRVTLTGQITNRSQETWHALNVYMLTSPTPIRTRAELAEAARTDADSQVGARRAGPGLYDEVGDLAPGDSVAYQLSVRRRDLGISGEAGVYWVGVHVLAAGDGGERDTVGRARTFMPLLPAPRSAAGQRARTRLALIVPFKDPVRRGTAGRLLNLPGWQHTFSPDGRLDRVLRLSSHTQQAITWAVDPAVLDAAESVARDNPVIDPGPTGGAAAGGATNSPSASPSTEPSSDPSTDPSPSPSDQPGQGDDNDEDAAKPSDAAVAARAWLSEFRRQARTRTVAALPYADLDVSAVLGQSRGSGLEGLYGQAVGLSTTTLAGYGVDQAMNVVAPASGYLSPTALRRLGSDTPVVLSEAALPDAAGPVVTSPGHAPVVLTDASAGAGGPKPNSQYAALSVRQRLLSDAALHALSSDRVEPLVVSMPQYWDPGDAAAASDFFTGLTQPWLQLVDLRSVVATASGPPTDGALIPVYPQAERLAELPVTNLTTTRDVTRIGQQFDRLLSANQSVDDNVARLAMLGSSANARLRPQIVRDQVETTGAFLRSEMARVRVEGPPFVMMSGESGPIQVTLVNGLDQTVTVGLRVVTPGSDLEVEKIEPVTLGPGRRTSIRLEAKAHDIGVHSVTLVTTDASGAPLGSSTRFSVRTSNVSTVIWVIMTIGGALLLLAIVVRLYRRIRRRKTTHGPLLPRERTDVPGQELKA